MRAHLPWLVLLILFTTALTARHLNIDALWYDETRSMYYSGGTPMDGPASLADTWTRVANSDVQAPGYYLLLNAWTMLTGQTTFARRALSLMVGLLAIAVVYRLGRAVDGPRAGLAAAVLLGASAYFITYLHEMRTYALVALLAALCALTYHSLITRGLRPLSAIAFVLSVVGLLYTHYFNVLFPAALALHHLIFVKKDRAWWLVTGLFALAGAIFLPWLPILLAAVADRAEPTGPVLVPPLNPMTLLRELTIEFSNQNVALLGFVGWLALRGRRFGWFVLGAVLALSLVVNALVPTLQHLRYVMMVWPLMALVFGIGLARLPNRYLAPLLVVWVGAGAWWALDYQYRMDANGGPGTFLPWGELRAQLDRYAQPGDTVAMHLPQGHLAHTHDYVGEVYLHTLEAVEHVGIISLDKTDEDFYIDTAFETLDDVTRLWSVFDPNQTPFRGQQLRDAFDAHYLQCGRLADTFNMHLNLYIARAGDAPPLHFGEGIHLAPRIAEAQQVGDTLLLTNAWRIEDRVPPWTYSTAVHVLDEAGNLVLQQDEALPPPGEHCDMRTFDLGGLPTGEYGVYAAVYDPATSERFEVVDEREMPLNENRAWLGAFTVVR